MDKKVKFWIVVAAVGMILLAGYGLAAFLQDTSKLTVQPVQVIPTAIPTPTIAGAEKAADASPLCLGILLVCVLLGSIYLWLKSQT